MTELVVMTDKRDKAGPQYVFFWRPLPNQNLIAQRTYKSIRIDPVLVGLVLRARRETGRRIDMQKHGKAGRGRTMGGHG